MRKTGSSNHGNLNINSKEFNSSCVLQARVIYNVFYLHCLKGKDKITLSKFTFDPDVNLMTDRWKPETTTVTYTSVKQTDL